MAKKAKKDAMPEAGVVEGAHVENHEEQAQAKPAGIVTSEGNTIDKIRIFQKDGATMVQVDYGKLDMSAATAKEQRKGMVTQVSRPLTPEQSAEYQRLYAADPTQAKEYAARQAYPMHVDDAAFHLKDATVNGRKVDYIILEKLDAEKLSDANKHLAGSWQLSFGEKGNKDSRFFGIMNREELACIKHRAEVTLDDKGNVTAVGKPLTMAEIASRVENRVVARHEALEAAKKVDWAKFKFPEGAVVTGLRYFPSKDNPDRVQMQGTVNGVKVIGLLAKNETTAVRNKLATLEQAAAANREFSTKVKSIVSNANTVSKDAAVAVIVARASDSAAKSFTSEQVKTLNAYAGSSSAEERVKVFDDLFADAKPQLDAANVNEAWQKDAQTELQDLAKGIVREDQQSLKV